MITTNNQVKTKTLNFKTKNYNKKFMTSETKTNHYKDLLKTYKECQNKMVSILKN